MSKIAANEYTPDYVSLPGETLAELLEAKEMTQAELARRMGRPLKTINEIVQGKARITAETALQLELVLGVSASFWNNRERQYREWLAAQQASEQRQDQLAWLHEVPIGEMVSRGWLAQTSSGVEQVRQLLGYFGVASVKQWRQLYEQPGAAFRRPAVAEDQGAVAAWLRRGEVLAQEVVCAAYDAGTFRQVLTSSRGLTRKPLGEVQSELVQRCAAAGVAVVFVSELHRTRICGATYWLSPRKAIIQLSFRYKTEDHLWFTFYHEAGHILLHGKQAVFLEGDGLDAEKDAEADRFAAATLIPASVWAQFVQAGKYQSKAAIETFAVEAGVSAGIVVGRLQHEKLLPHTHCNELKRKLKEQGERQ